jgi:predicted metal-dependent phosphoesterase TrpH
VIEKVGDKYPQEKRIKLELHIHTAASSDSLLTKRSLLLMCKIRKIDCIAITDHNILKSAISYRQLFKKHGIQIIPGEEILTTEGEIIGLFLKEQIEAGQSPEETVSEIIAQGGLVYVPHPYDEKRMKTVLSDNGIERISKYVNVMECHNGRNANPQYSEKQNEICERWGFQKVIGSDAHTAFELGRNYAWIEPFESEKEFLDVVERAVWVKRSQLLGVHYATRFTKAVKLLIKGDFRGLFRAFNRRYRKV